MPFLHITDLSLSWVHQNLSLVNSPALFVAAAATNNAGDAFYIAPPARFIASPALKSAGVGDCIMKFAEISTPAL